jgi:hypothetical protein
MPSVEYNRAIPNVRGPIGLRALCWKEGQDAFLSPAYAVRWERSGLLIATCQHGCREIPGDHCRCGVYIALFPWLAKQYLRGQGSALFLVEGCGKTRIPTQELRGFRAEQGYVLAAVVSEPKVRGNPEKLTGQDLTAFYGAQYFDVPVITMAEARESIQQQWEALGHQLPIDKGGY